jgi:hypothetical protein
MLILKKWLLLAYRLVGGGTKTKFPYVFEDVGGLGEVFLPLATVGVWFPVNNSWIDFQFIVDTGSTATILPSYIAQQMGIDLESLEEISMSGVEGTGVKSWLSEIKIKLGKDEFKVNCFFVDNPQVPFLLGRADLMNKIYSVFFDSKKQQIIFNKNN